MLEMIFILFYIIFIKGYLLLRIFIIELLKEDIYLKAHVLKNIKNMID